MNERIENRLDKLLEGQTNIEKSIIHIENEVELNRRSLEEHMRRTAAIEKQVGLPYLLKIIGGVSTLVTIAIKVMGILNV